MKYRVAIFVLLPLAVQAAAPTPKDFAGGLTLQAQAGYPVQELTLPDAFYAGVSRADLRDLRVFNAAGLVVPHALCGTQAPAAALAAEQNLPVFVLQAGRKPAPADGTRVEVRTPEGTQINVQEPAQETTDATQPVSAYVIDARALKQSLRALRLGWQTRDGASEVHVRVEASDDLDDWSTLVADTTLLRSSAEGQSLERARVPLPEGRYNYLRLERSGGGEPPQISQVSAEWTQAAATMAQIHFAALPLAAPDADGGMLFDSGRLAPVQAAAVHLPNLNMALRVALDSRAQPKQAWTERWNGEVNSIVTTEVAAASSPILFSITRDRWWRLRVLRGGESLGAARPTLELAYAPARLRFLAQGEGPYLLAYGSARVELAPAMGCDALLSGFPPDQQSKLLGQAQAEVAALGQFGGDTALNPPPRPTPMRQIVLWAVLIFGAGLLVVLALSLLKKMREQSAGGGVP